MTLVSFGGYVMLLAVILSHRYLLTYTNRIIIALSISDVLNLLSTTVSGLVGPVISYSEFNCLVVITPALAFPLVSMKLFLLIAVERYISVFCPLKYHSIITWRRLMVGIVAAYLCGFAIALLPIAGWNNRRIHQANNFSWNFDDCHQFLILRGDYFAFIHIVTVVETTIVTVLHVKILILARKLAKSIAAQRQSIYASSCSSIGNVNDKKSRKVSPVNQGMARGVKILFFLVIVYSATKFPMKICNAVQYKFWTENTIYTLNVTREVFLTCVVLSQSNSVFYPFIYAFANSDIYEVLKRKFTCAKLLEISGSNTISEMPDSIPNLISRSNISHDV